MSQQSNGKPSGARPSLKNTRLPTAEEALPFTPFTSFVPFDPSIVPFPTVGHSSNRPPLTSILDPDEAQKNVLSELDQEISNSHLGPSFRAQQTFQEFLPHLEADTVTRFKLKIPDLADFSQTPQTNSTNSQATAPPMSCLGAYARSVLDSTDVHFRYPTPVSPAAQSSGAKQSASEPSIPQKNNVFVAIPGSNPSPSTKANLQAPLIKNEAVTPTGPTHSSGFVGVAIPPPSPYKSAQSHSTIDTPTGQGDQSASRKRKRESINESPTKHALNVSLDQRKQTDLAVQSLKELLNDIFEAEGKEDIEATNDGAVSQSEFFMSTHDTAEGRILLAPNVQLLLEKSISKVITSGRLNDIASEDLLHVQQLCHNAIACAANTETNVPPDHDEASTEIWSRGIEVVKTSLRASKTLLKIITAGLENKEIYSEEMVSVLLTNVKSLLESCINPTIESRGPSSYKNFFDAEPAAKVSMSALLPLVAQVFELLGDVLLKVDLSDTSINILEYLSIHLIFVENASTEKEAILGIQKFEGLRRSAMDTLAKIFFRYSNQRDSIFDEILSSLEKLPVKRQSAKNFKIMDGKPVQLTSALLLQLIHTVASGSAATQRKSAIGNMDIDDETSSTSSSPTKQIYDRNQQINNHMQSETLLDDHEQPCDRLRSLIMPRSDSAQRHAAFVANFLIQRALSTKRSDDQPYRELLDIFIQDFVGLLGNPHWPAAELLLRALLTQLVSIANNEKSSAPAKNLSLDLMGGMGSGITELRLSVQKNLRTLEGSSDLLDHRLCAVGEDVLGNAMSVHDFLSTTGPHATVVTSLENNIANDMYLQNVRDYFLIHWARDVCNLRDRLDLNGAGEEDTNLLARYDALALWLTKSIEGKISAPLDSSFNDISEAQNKLAFCIATLDSLFCKNLRRIFSILVNSLASPHATVRSRSLKSVEKLLENDPSLLDRTSNVMAYILKATSDSSTMVRDSALRLIGKCLNLRSSLEGQIIGPMIDLSQDDAASVRKQSIKLLKDVFLNNPQPQHKAAIAAALLKRVEDHEETVRDMARQTLEDVWFAPFYKSCTGNDLSVKDRQILHEHTLHIVATSQESTIVLDVLGTLFKKLLIKSHKNSTANVKVCKTIVELLCDGIIDNATSAELSRKAALSTLTIFAKAEPNLFTSEQLMTLEPYIEHLSNTEDLAIFSSVVVIYRHTFPLLSSAHEKFMFPIQQKLLKNLQKLGKHELDEVTMCLQIINSVLSDTDRLVNLTISVLAGIKAVRNTDFNSQSPEVSRELVKLERKVTLAGYFGKNFQLDTHRKTFQQKLSMQGCDSVPSILVDTIFPLTAISQPQSMRVHAVESVSLICQSWPNLYEVPKVSGLFEEIFRSKNRRLERVVLAGFKVFYAAEESRSRAQEEKGPAQGASAGAERLGKSMVIGENDIAASTIAQHFLPHILSVSLSSYDDMALLATEVITSTNRQGLIHPKECEPALVALGTSPNRAIARLAFEEHQAMHHKHESMLEKELVKAIEQAFVYQRDVIKDPCGYTTDFGCKLGKFFEVLKGGSLAGRKKFLSNLCKKLDFNISKIDTSLALDEQYLYCRFVCQSLGLAEYGRIDEMLHLVDCVDKIFTATGNALSQRLEPIMEMAKSMNTEIAPYNQNIKVEELTRLTWACMILMLLWQTRTYLRRAWSLQGFSGGKSKAALKDTSKAPIRSANVTPESFIKTTDIMGSLVSMESMLGMCKTFLEALSIDNEHRANKSDEDDEDTMGGARLETPDLQDANGMPASGGSRSGGARRRDGSSRGTPGKRGRPRKTDRPSMGRRQSTKTSWGGGDDDSDGGWD